jgi:integrase
MKVWGLPRNPAVDVECPRFRISDDIDTYSREQVEALVRAASSEQDACLYLRAAFTGLRLGELLAPRWRDIDFQVSTCVASRGGLRRGVKERRPD